MILDPGDTLSLDPSDPKKVRGIFVYYYTTSVFGRRFLPAFIAEDLFMIGGYRIMLKLSK